MSPTTQFVDASMTVNDVIQLWPQTLPVFNAHGIDSCCGGSKTIGTVAERHGLELAALLEELTAIVREESAGET